MTIHLHQKDLPATVTFNGDIAVDCEMMGLNLYRDRLCLVQLSDGKGDVHLVQIAQGQDSAPTLQSLMEDEEIVKIFHYGEYDMAAMQVWLGIGVQNVFCTKIASRLCRTFGDKHSYKTLVKEFLGIEISKEEQITDWGAENLTDKQKEYAATDVLYLHQLRDKLADLLDREGRIDLAQACFDFLPVRAALDVAGWMDVDIFAHH